MKFETACFLLAVAYNPIATVAECTHGKLFVTDSASLRMITVALDDNLTSLEVTEMSTLALEGTPPLYLDQAAGSLVVTAAFWGSEKKSMTDGVMNLIHTGVRLEPHGDHHHLESGLPYKIVNAEIRCGPAYHPHSDSGVLVVSCDGFDDANPIVNTTILVFDESKFEGSAADPALLAKYQLDGSHHGAAIPVDDGVILHTLATEDRVNRVGNASSLPDTFQVVDYEGKILKVLTNTSDPNESCFGFHGSAHLGDTFYFACDSEEHGGILIVEYDEEGQNFTTRHMKYPNHPNLTSHRAGSIAAHHRSSYIVTDFADWEAEVYAPQLVAFEVTATDSEVSPDAVLHLGPLGQCEYAFEKAEGDWVVVLLPDTSVQVYKPGPTWTLLAEVTLGDEPWEECPWPAPFTVGYMQAFAFLNDTIYVMDLQNAEKDGTIGLTTLNLGFVPYSMTVAGVPEGFACNAHGQIHGDHDDGHEDNEPSDSVSRTSEKEPVKSDSEASASESVSVASGVTRQADIFWLLFGTVLSMWAVTNVA